MIVEIVTVFLAMLALDFVYAQYTKRAAHRKATLAANWAATILPLNYMVISGYLEHWWLLLPAMAGAWLGTHIAVSRDDG